MANTERGSLHRKLAERRIILLDGDIDEEMAAAVKFWILSFNIISDEKIILLIDSDGGAVQSALTIYDLIKLSKAPVTGLVFGDCKSMAIILLQACKVRLATTHSNFYLHELNWKSGIMILNKDSKTNIRKKLRELKRFRKKILDILKSRSKLSIEEIEKFMSDGENYETHLLSDEIFKMGLIDKVVEEYPLF